MWVNIELLSKYSESEIKTLSIDNLIKIHWKIKRLSKVEDLFFEHPINGYDWYWSFKFYSNIETGYLILLDKEFVMPTINFFTNLWKLIDNYIDVNSFSNKWNPYLSNISFINLKTFEIYYNKNNNLRWENFSPNFLDFTFYKWKIKDIHLNIRWTYKLSIDNINDLILLKDSINKIKDLYNDKYLEDLINNNLLLENVLFDYENFITYWGYTWNETKKINIIKKKISWFIYLLESWWKYKIWKAININHRIKQLETGNPFPIKLIHYFESSDYSNEEIKLHNHFKSKVFRNEWFCLNSKDIEYIKSI